MKALWCDTETTGVNAFRNGVIQIGGQIEIDGEIKESFDFRISTFPKDEIEAKALEVNHTTIEDIKGYPEPTSVHKAFVKLLSKYVNKFDKHDKFILAGYNIGFDAEMLRMWFKKCGDNYFYSYVFGGKIDVMSNVMTLCHLTKLELPDHKLETVARHFGIDVNFHDALDDIKATRKLYHILLEKQHEFLGGKFD